MPQRPSSTARRPNQDRQARLCAESQPHGERCHQVVNDCVGACCFLGEFVKLQEYVTAARLTEEAAAQAAVITLSGLRESDKKKDKLV